MDGSINPTVDASIITPVSQSSIVTVVYSHKPSCIIKLVWFATSCQITICVDKIFFFTWFGAVWGPQTADQDERYLQVLAEKAMEQAMNMFFLNGI